MKKIIFLTGRQVLDSRGFPTVEAEIILEGNFKATAIVPSGASTGSFEAIELRDGDKKFFNGKSVLKAVENIKTILAQNLVNKSFDQESLDHEMIKLDGTENKSQLGANAILAVSLAFAKANAQSQSVSLFSSLDQKAKLLPMPMMNLLNGGKHADKSADFQEYMIMPVGAKTFSEALRFGAETFQALKSILKENGFSTTVGDEGGFAPSLNNNEEPLQYLMKAIEKAGYQPGKDIAIALDVAASELYEDGMYNLSCEGIKITAKELEQKYIDWVSKYPIVSIEDAFHEDDYDSFASLTKAIGDKVQIVGDDLFVTNINRLQAGIDQKAGNAILIKPNQIGTLTETKLAINLAKANGYRSVMSHRSGETEDTTIADLAVGFETGQIKTGSLSRTDRIAKYNQLLRIEEELGELAKFENPFK